MKTVYIDFTDIGDYDDFYVQLKEKLTIPEFFGDNLDALYDSLTGFVELPLHIEFVNMSVDQLEAFEDLLMPAAINHFSNEVVGINDQFRFLSDILATHLLDIEASVPTRSRVQASAHF